MIMLFCVLSEIKIILNTQKFLWKTLNLNTFSLFPNIVNIVVVSSVLPLVDLNGTVSVILLNYMFPKTFKKLCASYKFEINLLSCKYCELHQKTTQI